MQTGGLFGPSAAWLLLFGFVFVLSVPYMLDELRRMYAGERWNPLAIYGVYFVALAVVQIRLAA